MCSCLLTFFCVHRQKQHLRHERLNSPDVTCNNDDDAVHAAPTTTSNSLKRNKERGTGQWFELCHRPGTGMGRRARLWHQASSNVLLTATSRRPAYSHLLPLKLARPPPVPLPPKPFKTTSLCACERECVCVCVVPSPQLTD